MKETELYHKLFEILTKHFKQYMAVPNVIFYRLKKKYNLGKTKQTEMIDK